MGWSYDDRSPQTCVWRHIWYKNILHRLTTKHIYGVLPYYAAPVDLPSVISVWQPLPATSTDPWRSWHVVLMLFSGVTSHRARMLKVRPCPKYKYKNESLIRQKECHEWPSKLFNSVFIRRSSGLCLRNFCHDLLDNRAGRSTWTEADDCNMSRIRQVDDRDDIK